MRKPPPLFPPRQYDEISDTDVSAQDPDADFVKQLKKMWQAGEAAQKSLATKPATGSCVFCGGTVVEKVEERWDGIMGHGSRTRKVSNGFYCKKCGLRYEFCPRLDDINEGAVDHQPENLYDDSQPDYEIVDDDE